MTQRRWGVWEPTRHKRLTMSELAGLFAPDDEVQAVVRSHEHISASIWADEHARRCVLLGLSIAVHRVARARGVLPEES